MQLSYIYFLNYFLHESKVNQIFSIWTLVKVMRLNNSFCNQNDAGSIDNAFYLKEMG